MPRFPEVARRHSEIRAKVFSKYSDKLKTLAREGRLIPLHIGDSYLLPPASAIDFTPTDEHSMYLYGRPQGETWLREKIAEVLYRNGWNVGPGDIYITAGATMALAAAIAATTNPGDEVLILSPYWPLIPGIVRNCGAVPIEIPVFENDALIPAHELAQRIRRHKSGRTAGLYFCTPNNPVGFILSSEHMEAIAEAAGDLWIYSDEVYECFAYDRPHVSIGLSLPNRTVTVRSFSKTYAMSGMRVGYAIVPAALRDNYHKAFMHMIYNAPVISQRAAYRALVGGDEWLENTRRIYRKIRDEVSDKLALRFFRPQGGTFIFFDCSQVMKNKDPEESANVFIEACLDEGVALAPGSSFGHGFQSYARICFTRVNPKKTSEAIEVINRVAARLKGI